VTRCILLANNEVSDEHAATIFSVELCRFRSRLGYTGKLHGGGNETRGQVVKK
jgi:hypothetical protein